MLKSHYVGRHGEVRKSWIEVACTSWLLNCIMSQAFATQLHTHPLNIYTTFLYLCCSLCCFLNSSGPVLSTELHISQRVFHGITSRSYSSHESDVSVSTWGEGRVSPPQMCHRCGAGTGVLKGSTAGSRWSREGWHSEFQSQESITGPNDPKKVYTGFR